MLNLGAWGVVAVVVLVGWVLALIVSVRGVRRDAGARGVELWARSRGLEPVPSTLALVGPELRRIRRFRRVGVVLGMLGLPLGASLPGTSPLNGLLVGWTVAIALAEATLRRRPSGSTGALASARRLDQYVPARLLVLQGTVLVLTLVAAVWALTIEPPTTDVGQLTPDSRILTAAGTAVAMTGALHLLQRWVVSRPQPVADPEEVAVDDAFRADSAHALGAASAGIGLLLLSEILWRPAYADVLNPYFDLAVLGLWLGSGLLVLWWANRAWSVRRPRVRVAGRVASP